MLTVCYLVLAAVLVGVGGPAQLALAAVVLGYLALKTWARHRMAHRPAVLTGRTAAT